MFTLEKNHLVLQWAEGDNSQYHYVWLRDNCHCEECLHPTTYERILVTAGIPQDIAPQQAELRDDCLSIIWNDRDHESRYSLLWLKSHDYSKAPFNVDPADYTPRLWRRELEDNVPEFDYQRLYKDEQYLLAWCLALRDHGITITRDAPVVDGEVERFALHIACVRETIYDRLHDVRATPGEYNAYNVASTNLPLKPHTDMPNYNSPPGVQMFHFLVNDCEGGKSTAVDGFEVARQLKEQDEEAYRILATTPVPYRMYSSRGDVISYNPMLTLDAHGHLKVFRFSNQLMLPVSLPPDKVEPFYEAYRKLGKLVDDPGNLIRFRLNSGDILATNNLRVMHGREAFDSDSGARHLQLSYMDFDDILSCIRMILKKQAA